MKKVLLSIFAIASVSFANAQCTDLFISEYVVGSDNNRAIEIYNPTNATISLNSKYRLVRYSNAASQATAESDPLYWINLGAISVSSYSTFVFVTDKRDQSQTTGLETHISASLQSKTDALIAQTPPAAAYICPIYANNRTLYQNGNDALGLQKETTPGVWTFVDIFGCIGECPIGFASGVLETSTNSNCASSTAGWSDLAPYSSPPAGYNEGLPPTGQGYYFKRVWTQNKSLKRKADVKVGVTTNPALQTFNPSVQWDSTYVGQSKNNFSNLGSHTCDCKPTSIKNDIQLSKNSLNVFPIPANNELNIVADAFINSIEINSLLGQTIVRVSSDDLNGKTEYKYDTSNLESGIYFINVVFQDNTTLNKKIVISK